MDYSAYIPSNQVIRYDPTNVECQQVISTFGGKRGLNKLERYLKEGVLPKWMLWPSLSQWYSDHSSSFSTLGENLPVEQEQEPKEKTNENVSFSSFLFQ